VEYSMRTPSTFGNYGIMPARELGCLLACIELVMTYARLTLWIWEREENENGFLGVLKK